MPYVGFHPDIDPGHERAVKGGRKLRKWVVEVIPDHSMLARISNTYGEYLAHGRYLIGSWNTEPEDMLNPPPPDRVIAYGWTTRKPLVVYYRTPWPVQPQPWPDTAPVSRENPT
jgi:hypothetical protein